MSIRRRIRGIVTAAGLGAVSWLPFAALSGVAIVAVVRLRFGAAAGPPPIRILAETTMATAAAFGAVAGALWAVQVALFEPAFRSSRGRRTLRSGVYGAIAGLLSPFLVPHSSIYAHLGPEWLLAACTINGGAVGLILMAAAHYAQSSELLARSDHRDFASLSTGESVTLDIEELTARRVEHHAAERVAAAVGTD